MIAAKITAHFRRHFADYATAIAAALLGGIVGPCIARTAFLDHPEAAEDAEVDGGENAAAQDTQDKE